MSKKRDGAKVTKKYDKAKTPYQRLMLSPHLTENEKRKLKIQYESLDPVELLNQLIKLQDNFWKHAWKSEERIEVIEVDNTDNVIIDVVNLESMKEKNKNAIKECLKIESQSPENNLIKNSNDVDGLKNHSSSINHQQVASDIVHPSNNIRRYRHARKPGKHLMPRTWLTREDAFANEWHGIRVQLELNPTITAKVILKNLIKEKPDEFKIGQLRTLQRRIMKWYLKKLKMHQEIQSKKSPIQEASSELYVALISQAVFEPG